MRPGNFTISQRAFPLVPHFSGSFPGRRLVANLPGISPASRRRLAACPGKCTGDITGEFPVFHEGATGGLPAPAPNFSGGFQGGRLAAYPGLFHRKFPGRAWPIWPNLALPGLLGYPLPVFQGGFLPIPLISRDDRH